MVELIYCLNKDKVNKLFYGTKSRLNRVPEQKRADKQTLGFFTHDRKPNTDFKESVVINLPLIYEMSLTDRKDMTIEFIADAVCGTIVHEYLHKAVFESIDEHTKYVIKNKQYGIIQENCVESLMYTGV